MAEITYRQALHDTLREELQRDENVFLMHIKFLSIIARF